MTPAQARALPIGAEVTHILTNERGTVVRIDPVYAHILWEGMPQTIAYLKWRMHSIHVHANPEPGR